MLEECGAPQSAGDIAEAERLLHRGQAAALMAVDHRWSGRYDEDDQLVEQVLAVEAQEYVPLKTKHVEVAGASAKVALPQPGEPIAASPTSTPAEPVTVRESISILELAERLIKEKAQLNEWRDKTQDQVRAVAQLFVKMLGADEVALVSQARIADYRSYCSIFQRPMEKIPRTLTARWRNCSIRPKPCHPKRSAVRAQR